MHSFGMVRLVRLLAYMRKRHANKISICGQRRLRRHTRKHGAGDVQYEQLRMPTFGLGDVVKLLCYVRHWI